MFLHFSGYSYGGIPLALPCSALAADEGMGEANAVYHQGYTQRI